MVVEMWITCPIGLLAEKFARAGPDFPKAFIVDCLRRIGETNAAANENVLGEKREKILESRRDEVLKDPGA
jgi:hypothetical protein